MDGPTRILLIDDDETFRYHATRFLERHHSLEVVGGVGDVEQGVERAAALQPDVILLDLSMPGLDGFAGLPLLAAAAPGARLVAVTMLEAGSYRELAFAHGAHGFVPKSRLVDDLLPEIRRQRAVSTGPPPSPNTH